MIIGNGDIASVLKEAMRTADDGFIFFASGVSNSQCKDKEEFLREVRLLLKQDEKKHLVYFSSLGVFKGDTPYMKHKRYMETLVKAVSEHYTIIRIGNITWGSNPHTFINAYFKKPYDIKLQDKFMVEKEEFLYWIDLIPEWSCEMNIPGKKMSVHAAITKYGHA